MPRFGVDRRLRETLSDMLWIDAQVSAANCVHYNMRKEKRKAFIPEAAIVFVEKNMYNYNKLWSQQMDKNGSHVGQLDAPDVSGIFAGAWRAVCYYLRTGRVKTTGIPPGLES